MVCGGLAGMIAKTATNPLDRIRMLSQTGEHGIISSSTGELGEHGVTSSSTGRLRAKPTTWQLYKSIIQREGVIGLWAGNGANLLRVFPSKSIVFSTNDLYSKQLGAIYYGSDEKYQFSGRTLPWSLSFLAGGMAGMTASALTYPLDLARGRIAGKVAGPEGKKAYRGIIQTVIVTAREEGPMAIYKGISPTLLGSMPYEGIKFGTVAILERAFPLEKIDGDDGSSSSVANNVTRKSLFGGTGGVMATMITYPNDTVRRFLQLQGSRGTSEHFDGYWDCVKKTYAKYGIERFYRGSLINIVRMAPNTAIQFGSYELLTQLTKGYF
jgi:solute carrier family 25 phosphate transporter 23/24/25/41